MKRLKEKAVWLTLTFDDQSKMNVYTTLSEEILKTHGVSPRKGYFYDLNNHRYIEFRDDIVDISISDEKPVYTEEVFKFASRFI